MSPRVLPLQGLRIAVTRPAEAARELADRLREAGAEPLIVPLTRIEAPLDEAPLRLALEHLHLYHWIVFTSANAVRVLARLGGGARLLDMPIAAVGHATAAAVRDCLGREADVIPGEFASDAIVPAMLQRAELSGARVLWPRAELARDALRHDLHTAGALVDDPVAYRTIPDEAAAHALAASVAHGEIDAITFTAPSAVDSFAAAGAIPSGCVVAVIGPSTAVAARKHGIPVHVEPEQYMIPALVAALAQYMGRSV